MTLTLRETLFPGLAATQGVNMYTVKQLARLAGVSVRTLHHYHDIGLLVPASVGENRYRYYGEEELLRLQQILFYREIGFSLDRIAEILDRPGFDHVAALREHRAHLAGEAERYRQLIRTIDRTIAGLTGERTMKNADLYKGFPPEKQSEYEDWLVEQYGEDMRGRILDSKKRFTDMTEAEQGNVMSELADVEGALAGRMSQGIPAESESLDMLLGRHRAWVAFMWGRDCPPDAYAGLADLYLAHPDFEKRYETIASGFTAYLTSAMKAYAGRVSSG